MEIIKRGLNLERQKGIPVVYDNLKMELGFRADIIVENRVIIELKSIVLLQFIQNNF
jgi:GxxExxY protein